MNRNVPLPWVYRLFCMAYLLAAIAGLCLTVMGDLNIALQYDLTAAKGTLVMVLLYLAIGCFHGNSLLLTITGFGLCAFHLAADVWIGRACEAILLNRNTLNRVLLLALSICTVAWCLYGRNVTGRKRSERE